VSGPARAEQTDAQNRQADAEDDPWRHHDQVASSHPALPYAAVQAVSLCGTSAHRERACPVKLSW
jgi:hypothetical protein